MNCWPSKKVSCITAISYERLEPLDTTSISNSNSADALLDLGETACGQLIMEIMFAMRKLAPGQTLLVTAYDPAAPLDIAAWCRMTGNTLVKTLLDHSGKQFLLHKRQ